MIPADRDPPVYAPPPASPPWRGAPPTVDNPLMKSAWTKDDLFLAFVLAQLSSGRSGDDAVKRARETADLLMPDPTR